jgi:hypothetical protein
MIESKDKTGAVDEMDATKDSPTRAFSEGPHPQRLPPGCRLLSFTWCELWSVDVHMARGQQETASPTSGNCATLDVSNRKSPNPQTSSVLFCLMSHLNWDSISESGFNKGEEERRCPRRGALGVGRKARVEVGNE